MSTADPNRSMTTAEITLAVFAAFSSVGLLAYGQNVAKALKDRSGTETISLRTWGLLLASNASAAAYAIEQGDQMIAVLFLASSLGCGAMLLILASKQL